MAVPVAEAISSYHDFNASIVEELREEPSALEFMRYVAKNRPFVVRDAAAQWPALRKWDAEYLKQVMTGRNVKVAVTPFGNADAIVEHGDSGRRVFVEPYETDESFADFLDYLQTDFDITDRQTPAGRNVKYAQSQNDNLRAEYAALLADIPSEIAFARIALQQEQPDAINLWIGNARSVTSLHKDHYENLYVQVHGEKHFVLLSPTEMPCVNEVLVPRGRYTPSTDDVDRLVIEPSAGDDGAVPVPVWDPDEPSEGISPYSHMAKPLRVTLRPGDMLYLPALWYHKVSQTSGKEGFACAVNYWYDMSFDGSFWTSNNLLRNVHNECKHQRRFAHPGEE